MIARDMRSLTTAVDSIVGAAVDMGLQMNMSKTNYMFSTRSNIQQHIQHTL